MASMATGVSFSMTSGIGEGGYDVHRVATAARTTLKLNQKNSLSESTCMLLGMNKYRGSGAIRTVSKAVGYGQEMSKSLRVGLICGGPSAERGISLNSARSVLDHIQVIFRFPMINWALDLCIFWLHLIRLVWNWVSIVLDGFSSGWWYKRELLLYRSWSQSLCNFIRSGLQRCIRHFEQFCFMYLLLILSFIVCEKFQVYSNTPSDFDFKLERWGVWYERFEKLVMGQ